MKADKDQYAPMVEFKAKQKSYSFLAKKSSQNTKIVVSGILLLVLLMSAAIAVSVHFNSSGRSQSRRRRNFDV